MNAEIRVNKAQPVQTEITVPGDKSISHRAVLFASLSNGTCTIRNYLEGEDCLRTIDAMKACGVEVERPSPCLPFMVSIAFWPSAAEIIVTNAKPRERPALGSVMVEMH